MSKKKIQQTPDATIDIKSANDDLLNINKHRIFADCGMERTVFDIDTSNNRICADITFKKTRLRDRIPEFAGIYWLFPEALNISKGTLFFKLSSPNKTIKSIDVEIKPEGRLWMHEVFTIRLSKETYEADCKITLPEDFTDKRTLQCMNEITFVIHPTDFVNDTKLTGQLVISDIAFSEDTIMIPAQLNSVASSVTEKLGKIDNKVEKLNTKLDKVVAETKQIHAYIENQLKADIDTLKQNLSSEMNILDEINQKLSSQNNKYDPQIINAINAVDVKISDAFDKCAKQINKDLTFAGQNISDTIIDNCKKHLEELFGKSLYKSLQEYTRASLVSAECLWESCKNINENSVFDYSGVCISASSALENELKRIFFDGFYSYLNKNQKNNAYVYGKRKNFTMNTVSCIFTRKKVDFDITKEVYSNFEKHPQDFAIEMNKYLARLCNCDTQDFDYKEHFADEHERIEMIRTHYRNKAAHTDSVDLKTASGCYNAIVGKSKAERMANDIPNIILSIYEKIRIVTLLEVEN